MTLINYVINGHIYIYLITAGGRKKRTGWRGSPQGAKEARKPPRQAPKPPRQAPRPPRQTPKPPRQTPRAPKEAPNPPRQAPKPPRQAPRPPGQTPLPEGDGGAPEFQEKNNRVATRSFPFNLLCKSGQNPSIVGGSPWRGGGSAQKQFKNKLERPKTI